MRTTEPTLSFRGGANDVIRTSSSIAVSSSSSSASSSSSSSSSSWGWWWLFVLLVHGTLGTVIPTADAAAAGTSHHHHPPHSSVPYGIHQHFRAVRVLNRPIINDDGDEDDGDDDDTRAPPDLPNSERVHHHKHSDDNDDDVQERYLTQRLDHFRWDNDRTFPQRYFWSDRYARRSVVVTGPTTASLNATAAPTTTLRTHTDWLFICVGGEGPALTKSVLIDSVHCTGDMLHTAQRLFAMYPPPRHDDDDDSNNSSNNSNNNNNNGVVVSLHLAALEHRYYGASYPSFGDDEAAAVTNENLVYLSSRQAAADLAHFIVAVGHRARAGGGGVPRVVLFGGSYPGMLAAWVRLHYPHLVYAAVSSSAPIQAVVDFAAYQNHVADVLRRFNRHNDTNDCATLVATGHAALAAQVEEATGHRDNRTLSRLARHFHLCQASALYSVPNVRLWLGDGVFDWHVQENDPSCTDTPYCNVEKKCQALTLQYQRERNQRNATSETAAVNALAWMVRNAKTENHPTCVELDWPGTLNYIANPKTGKEGGLRSWLWQTCTEFGFYQTCANHSGCPFARGYHPLSQDMEICRVAFGVEEAWSVVAAVQATNEWTGGWQLAATRVLSVTGTTDPWSELAIETPRPSADQLPVYQVPGASHHYWTHPVQPTDDPAIQAARDCIFDTVHDWLLLFPEDERTKNIHALVS